MARRHVYNDALLVRVFVAGPAAGGGAAARLFAPLFSSSAANRIIDRHDIAAYETRAQLYGNSTCLFASLRTSDTNNVLDFVLPSLYIFISAPVP
jgi:hypothetical protein